MQPARPKMTRVLKKTFVTGMGKINDGCFMHGTESHRPAGMAQKLGVEESTQKSHWGVTKVFSKTAAPKNPLTP